MIIYILNFFWGQLPSLSDYEPYFLAVYSIGCIAAPEIFSFELSLQAHWFFPCPGGSILFGCGGPQYAFAFCMVTLYVWSVSHIALKLSSLKFQFGHYKPKSMDKHVYPRFTFKISIRIISLLCLSSFTSIDTIQSVYSAQQSIICTPYQCGKVTKLIKCLEELLAVTILQAELIQKVSNWTKVTKIWFWAIIHVMLWHSFMITKWIMGS